jgi:hypothetical protein
VQLVFGVQTLSSEQKLQSLAPPASHNCGHSKHHYNIYVARQSLAEPEYHSRQRQLWQSVTVSKVSPGACYCRVKAEAAQRLAQMPVL